VKPDRRVRSLRINCRRRPAYLEPIAQDGDRPRGITYLLRWVLAAPICPPFRRVWAGASTWRLAGGTTRDNSVATIIVFDPHLSYLRGHESLARLVCTVGLFGRSVRTDQRARPAR